MGTRPVLPLLRRPLARSRARRSGWPLALVGGLIGAVLAMGVAVAWIPLRSEPSVDVALALVAVTALVGVTAHRTPVIGAATGSAVGFTFFDTVPYEHFAINQGADVVTAVLLVIVGLATGELVVRVVRQRRFDLGAGGDLIRVREAADRLARGQELVVMIGAVADQISTVLGAEDCSFSTEEGDAELRYIDRDATLGVPLGASHRLLSTPPGYRELLALPVLSLGVVVGHFVLRPGPAATLGRDHLLVAVTLADQVGAALAAQAPPISATDPLPSSTVASSPGAGRPAGGVHPAGMKRSGHPADPADPAPPAVPADQAATPTGPTLRVVR